MTSSPPGWRASAWLADAEPTLLRPREDFLAHRAERDLALFDLFLCLQECIDLASHWIADDGLRNLIAHGYASLDPARVHAEARDGLAPIREFLSAAAAAAGA